MVRRREFIVGAGASLGAAWLDPEAMLRADELGRARTISIFHTTDLHGHILPTSTYEGLDDVGGFARCATCIRQWRRESPHALTVDVGDVVQGTAASLRTGGRLMVDLFNRLGYDAWTLGNHDFDWGPEKLVGLLEASQSPVLTANVTQGGRMPGGFDGAWKNVRPWTIREVGGFRIALVGLITPGLAYWLPPERLDGVTAVDPVASLRAAMAEAKAEKPDAVVVLGHMGWRFNDDYANPVRELLRDAKDVDVYLAGHSHQNKPAWMLHGTLCSQASYHGIHCGRVDLTFDLATRKLVERRVYTLLMDDRYVCDPLVMQVSQPDLAASDEELARPVARVTREIPGTGRDSPLGRLLCESFASALARSGTPVDGVVHGTFATGPVPSGQLTVGGCWRIIPYENLLVTAELTGGELMDVLAEDANDAKSDRMLWPFEVRRDENGKPTAILREGKPVAADQRFAIAFNSYDAQSGGRRLMRLREILSKPSARRRTTTIDTRTALIDALLDRGEIG
ncbi:MAG: bifunctional metallophosphatase/5'-nucleotidase [Planctomycetia bacterium]